MTKDNRPGDYELPHEIQRWLREKSERGRIAKQYSRASRVLEKFVVGDDDALVFLKTPEGGLVTHQRAIDAPMMTVEEATSYWACSNPEIVIDTPKVSTLLDEATTRHKFFRTMARSSHCDRVLWLLAELGEPRLIHVLADGTRVAWFEVGMSLASWWSDWSKAPSDALTKTLFAVALFVQKRGGLLKARTFKAV